MIVSALGAVLTFLALALGGQFVHDMDLEYGALGGLAAIVIVSTAIAFGIILVF